MEEIFDIVDRRDIIIGKGARSELHKKRLLHRTTHIFIKNKAGKFLVMKRAEGIDIRPGYYSSIGEHVNSGESYEEAAKRGAKEELGISLKKLKKLGKFISNSEGRHQITQLFESEHEGPFRIDVKEVANVKFYSKEEIEDLIRTKTKVSGLFKTIWSWYNARH